MKSDPITLDEFIFINIPSKARAQVIEAAVTIEKIVSTILPIILHIDIETSKSFGKTNGALSFNQKINLLTDIKFIKSEERTALIKFTEIRNLFAHRSEILFFMNCFKHNDLKQYLIKRYGEQGLVSNFEEEKDEMLFNALFEEVKEICRNLFGSMIDAGKREGELNAKARLHDILLRNINTIKEVNSEFKDIMDNIFEKVLEEFDTK